MPETLTIPGRADFVTLARSGIRMMLAHAPDDARDIAALITSEYVTNAIRWTASGQGGEVRILVDADPDSRSARIEVADDGPRTGTGQDPDEDSDQHGRGLAIVAELAKDWGQRGARGGRGVYWAVIAWD